MERKLVPAQLRKRGPTHLTKQPRGASKSRSGVDGIPIVSGQGYLRSHIEADCGEVRKRGAEDLIGGIRIDEDIELGRGRRISRNGICSAHNDDRLEQFSQRWFDVQRYRQICERSKCYQSQFSGTLASEANECRRTPVRSNGAHRGRQLRTAKTTFVMEKACVPMRPDKRSAGSAVDWHISGTKPVEDGERVRSRFCDVDIACDGGDGDKLNPGRRH